MDPEIGYIFPEPRQDHLHNPIPPAHQHRQSLLTCRAIAYFGIITLTLGMFVMLIISSLGWGMGSEAVSSSVRSNWDSSRMGALQPMLLEQIRALLLSSGSSMGGSGVPSTESSIPIPLRNLSKNDPSTCYSPICLQTGLNLLEAMNFSVDPCEDFYEFACGSWTHAITHSEDAEGHPPPPPTLLTTSDQFSKINEKVISATQRILDEPSPPPNDPTFQAFLQAKKLYAQCKDLQQLELDGLPALWKLLDGYGGWPLLGDHFHWSSSQDWIIIAGDLARLSVSSILSLEVKQHPASPLQNVIYPKFFVSREYLIEPSKYPKIISAYKEFIVGLASELGRWGAANASGGSSTQNSLEELKRGADEIVEFESDLAKLGADEIEPSRPVRKAQFQIHKLQRESNLMTPKFPKYPNKINWLKFIRQVFLSSGIVIGDDEKVFVNDVSYVRALSPLLAATPTSTLLNYLAWRLLATFTTGTTATLRSHNFRFHSSVYGMKRIPLRASTCAIVVKDGFALALGMKIVRDLMDLSSKQEVEKMVENVRVAMERLLSNKELEGPSIFPLGMSRKLSTLKHCIGYPASFQNTSGINAFYEDLNLGSEEDEVYLKKYIRLRLWLYDKTLSNLREPFDSDCWSGSSWSTIGEAYAYFDTARNSINFPIGLLQAPFYRHNVPTYINYGGIGAIIGHEISHSVNIEGWIKVGLIQSLEDYWECLLHHYSSYEVPSLGQNSRVNGLRTRTENLADHLGLAASYWAFLHLNEKETAVAATASSTKSTLPALELFSPSQMFFLSFAHMWCVNGPDEWLADELQASSHTPGRYRVLGSLQNSEDFARSYQCPVGSRMNPKDKCNSVITASKTKET